MLTFEEYRHILIGDSKPINWNDFQQKTNLNGLWEKFEKNDIRYKTFAGDKTAFLRFFYDRYVEGIDTFIRAYFERRIRIDEIPDFNFAPVMIENGMIENKPDGTRYIRSMFAREMSSCSQKASWIFTRDFTRMHAEGIIRDAFTVPSVFKDYDLNDASYVPESAIVTVRSKFAQMSVFSPRTYRTLLLNQKEHIKTDTVGEHKLLCPTASWGSPVIATKYLGYKEVHIVDVQKSVLDKCHEIHKEVFSSASLFDDKYSLKTFCTPSEKMESVVDADYDHIFFCPPYYEMEIYGENSEDQSTTVYKSYDDWLNGYWKGTVQASHTVLKKGGIFSFTINNHAGGYELAEDMLRIAKESFKYVGELIIKNIDKNIKLNVARYELCFELRKE